MLTQINLLLRAIKEDRFIIHEDFSNLLHFSRVFSIPSLMHINIFIDESKYFQKWILIFGGFCSENTKAFLDRWISTLQEDIWHPWHREMKSSEKDLGKTYLEDGLLPKKQKHIKSVFGRIVSETYTKDSYEWYAEWLCDLFDFLRSRGTFDAYSEIRVYIDQIKLLSDNKSLERNLKKELQKWESRISQVICISSKSSSSIQLADLVTWLYKDSLRSLRDCDFQNAFGDIEQLSDTKKS